MFSNYGYRRKGRYVEHLRNWLKHFDLQQFHFIDFAELINQPNLVLQQLCDFLGISFEVNATFGSYNKTSYSSAIDRDIGDSLATYYEPYDEELFSLLGKRFDWRMPRLLAPRTGQGRTTQI